MIGFRPGKYWQICWRFVAPIFLLFITVYGLIGYQPLTYEEYEYPGWANALGWSIAGSSVMMIPAVAIYKLCTTPGSLRQRLRILTTPWRDQQVSVNGVTADATQVRLSDTKEASEV